MEKRRNEFSMSGGILRMEGREKETIEKKGKKVRRERERKGGEKESKRVPVQAVVLGNKEQEQRTQSTVERQENGGNSRETAE